MTDDRRHNDQLLDEIREMRREGTERHIQTVQRLSVIETNTKQQTEDIEDYGKRIGTLERAHWKQTGIVAGLLGALQFAWNYFTSGGKTH